MFDRKKLAGIYVALYGCYDEKGRVDGDRVRKLARHFVNLGVAGLYLTGSSGEGMLQSEAERATVYAAAAAEVKGETVLIAHVGAPSTGEAVRLAEKAAKAGIDAISAVPNIYYPASEAMIQAHWNAIIDAAQLPFIMYNTPGTTGTDISMKLFGAMCNNSLVAGIKHTGASPAQINAFRCHAGEDFAIFNGMDNQLLAGLVMGASGGIGGTYGAMPEIYLHMYKAYVRGDWNTARLWQDRANEILALMKQRLSGNIGCAFSRALLMNRTGLDIGRVREPALPIDPTDPVIETCAAKIAAWLAE